MVKPSNETIDFSTWPVAEQQLAFDELSLLLGITPTVDITTLTDAELVAYIDLAVDEVAGRPGTVVKPYDEYVLGTAHVFRETGFA